MADDLSLFQSAIEEFGARVRAVTDDQWSAATPCRDWSVADLVGHLIDEHNWVPPLLDGLELAQAREVVRQASAQRDHRNDEDDPASEWLEACNASERAWRRPGVLDMRVYLSRGLTPARVYLSEMMVDLTVHGWDLGVAIGYPERLPDELASYVLSSVREMGNLSASGMFDEPMQIADSATDLEKLIALTGRDPR
jgi:uncharacterized protein (TIGR03086 family)